MVVVQRKASLGLCAQLAAVVEGVVEEGVVVVAAVVSILF